MDFFIECECGEKTKIPTNRESKQDVLKIKTECPDEWDEFEDLYNDYPDDNEIDYVIYHFDSPMPCKSCGKAYHLNEKLRADISEYYKNKS